VNCLLCRGEVDLWNASEICAECRLVVWNLFGRPVEERWRPAVGLDGIIVSDQGRVARALPIDRSHRYPRVSLRGRKQYVHALVAGAFHGARPAAQLARHLDDVPDNCSAENLAWGTAKQNAADRSRNRKARQQREGRQP
jgi:hypothetical protein